MSRTAARRSTHGHSHYIDFPAANATGRAGEPIDRESAAVTPENGIRTLQVRLGDPLVAGSRRYYLVYYRDPIVLGGCPLASTFNATQGGLIPWRP